MNTPRVINGPHILLAAILLLHFPLNRASAASLVTVAGPISQSTPCSALSTLPGKLSAASLKAKSDACQAYNAARAAQQYGTWLSPARVSNNCLAQPDFYVLDCWLTEHPNVANNIMWTANSSAGPAGKWSAWSPTMQGQLRDEFKAMVTWIGKGMSTDSYPQSFPTPLLPLPSSPGQSRIDTVDGAVARKIYFSLVATSLAVELTATVPWSVTSFSVSMLYNFYAPGSLMWLDTSPANAYPGYMWISSVSPATPAYTLSFLKSNQIIGTSVLGTAAQLFQWSTQLSHMSEGTAQDYWGQYSPPGAILAPLSLIVEGSTYTGSSTTAALFKHWTWGCLGTTDFTAMVLRLVNIPVERKQNQAGHTAPYFVSIDRYWSHGDDPYDRSGWVTPQAGFNTPAPEEFFISSTQWNTWFGASVDGTTQLHNTGRQPTEIGINYGSDWLMVLYCLDLRQGAGHAAGQIFQNLSWFGYSVADLENRGLWQLLDAKVNANQYCLQFALL